MSKKKKDNQRVWKYKNKEVLSLKDMPEGAIGFIYLVKNLSKGGKTYIGRKMVCSNRKRKLTLKEKSLPENARKKVIREMKEVSGWQNYCGSSLLLKNDVFEGDVITKTILRYCFSKAELTYYEAKEIFCSGALENDNSYNDWVSARVYKRNLKTQ